MAKLPATVHTIFKSALSAASEDDRPPQPWHLGGAVRPVCPARRQVELAIELAELFEDRLAPAEVRPFEQVLAAVRAYLAGKNDGRNLRALSERVKGTSALAIAGNAAGAAATLARGKPDLVHTGAQAAAAKAVTLMGPGARTRLLLETLDQEIVRAECGQAFAQTHHTPTIERVLWRASDSSKKTVHFVARLSTGHFAAQVKLVKGKAPSWLEGSAEEVVSIVPETSFAGAVKQVLGAANLPTLTLVGLRAGR